MFCTLCLKQCLSSFNRRHDTARRELRTVQCQKKCLKFHKAKALI